MVRECRAEREHDDVMRLATDDDDDDGDRKQSSQMTCLDKMRKRYPQVTTAERSSAFSLAK